MKKEMQQYAEKLKVELLMVCEGNPGACRVVKELQTFKEWPSMMTYLARSGPRGPKLWLLYKDNCMQNIVATGNYILARMKECVD